MLQLINGARTSSLLRGLNRLYEGSALRRAGSRVRVALGRARKHSVVSSSVLTPQWQDRADRSSWVVRQLAAFGDAVAAPLTHSADRCRAWAQNSLLISLVRSPVAWSRTGLSFAAVVLGLQGVAVAVPGVIPGGRLSLVKLAIGLLMGALLFLAMRYHRATSAILTGSWWVRLVRTVWDDKDFHRAELSPIELAGEEAGDARSWLIGAVAALLYCLLPIKYFGAGAAGLVFLALLFRQPLWGLYATAFVTPFLPFAALTGLIALTVGTAVVKEWWEGRTPLRRSPLDLGLLTLALVWFIGAVTSVLPRVSLVACTVFVIALSLCYLAVYMVREVTDLKRVVLMLFASTLLISLHGIYQYVFGGPTNAGWVDVAQNPELTTRVFSTLENPNHLAEYLVLALPMVAVILVAFRNVWTQILALFGVAVGSLTLVLTYSRGGWLGFAVTALVFVALVSSRLILLGIAILPTLPFLLPGSILNRITTLGGTGDSSLDYRANVWAGAWRMLKENIWGLGPGSDVFHQLYPLYSGYAPEAFHAHNLYLQIGVEVGIIGLAVLVWFFARFAQEGIRFLFETRHASDSSVWFGQCLTMASLAGVLGLFVHGVAEDVWFYSKVLLLFWLVVGMLLSVVSLHRRKQLG